MPPTAPAGNPVPAGKPAPARSADQPAGANLFQTERITAIHLQLDGDARASLRRKKRRFARATVTIAGTRMVDVGVRLKGNRSMRDLDDRPSFIVDFDRYAPGRTYRGLRRLLLHAMVEDPTRLRETLGYALYREVGVPAPRTGYVRVRLDDAPAKLYLAVQAIDEAMLAEHFGDATGNLYEGEYGCDVRSADVWGFELDSGADTSRSDLRRFAATVPAGVTAVFADRPGAVDRREVLAYLAMSALIGDFDGYRHHHNYFLYHDPSTRRWSMLPWGIDRVLYEPIDIFDSLGLLARMCLDDATCRLDYVRAMHKAVDVFEAADLPAQASRLAALIGPGPGWVPRGALLGASPSGRGLGIQLASQARRLLFSGQELPDLGLESPDSGALHLNLAAAAALGWEVPAPLRSQAARVHGEGSSTGATP